MSFPTTVDTDADLYIAVNATSTQLTDNPLTSGATTVNVVSTTGFPMVGFISIDNEIIKYTGTTGTSFTGCTRGADGTSASSHVQNSQVFHNVIAAHHNVLKDQLIAVESFISTHLGLATTVTSTEFSYLSGVTSAIQTQINTKATDTLVVHLAGTENITGLKTFTNDVNINATQKLYLDGGSDTYISESGANRQSFFVGGTERFRVDGNGTLVSILGSTDFSIPSAQKLFLDGGGDTYILESSANVTDIVTGGTTRLRLSSTEATYVTTRSDTPGANALQIFATSGLGIRMDTSNNANFDHYNGSVWTTHLIISTLGDVYTTAWQDYSGTSTVVGWSSFTSKLIFYKKIGKTVFVSVNLNGTSDSTSLTFTLPFTNSNDVLVRVPCQIVDNGATASLGRINLPANTATVTGGSTIAGGAWTASGTKQLNCEFWYQTT